MKDLRGPTITPGLNHTATFPMLGIGEEKAGRIAQLSVLMRNDEPLTPIALQPHHFRKGPILLGITVATPDPYRAETLGVPVPELRRHRIHPPPLPLPLDMPCAFELTDPVFPRTLNAAGDLQSQEPVVK